MRSEAPSGGQDQFFPLKTALGTDLKSGVFESRFLVAAGAGTGIAD
jgi:hypothetical protein